MTNDENWTRAVEVSRPELERLARALVRNSTDADDLVQDTLTAALARPPLERARPMAWLGTVARNLAAKRRRARMHAELDPDELGTRDADPRHAELLELVRRAAFELEEPYGTVIRLRFLEGRSVEDVSRACDRPIHTVRSQIRRGLVTLETRLDRELGHDRRDWRAALLAGFGPRPGRRTHTLTTAGGWLVLAAATIGLVAASWWRAANLRERPVRAVAQAEPARANAVDSPASPDPARGARAPLGEPAPAASAPANSPASVGTPAPEVLGRLELEVVAGAGRPVEGAAVHVLPHRGARDPGAPLAVTDVDGRASVPVTEDDRRFQGGPRADFWVLHPDHVPSGLIGIPFPIELPTLRLSLERAESRVALRILDPHGAAVRLARVNLLTRSTPPLDLGGGVTGVVWARTVDADENGVCTLRLAAGMHQVVVQSTEFLDRPLVLECAPGVDRELEVTLFPGAVLAGLALDAAGEPCGGAELALQWGRGGAGTGMRSARADDEGRFRVAGLPEGAAWIVASDAARGIFATEELHLQIGAEVEWFPRLEERPGLSLDLRDAAGRPVADAFVQLMTAADDPLWRATGRSSPEGEVRFPAVPQGVALRFQVFLSARELQRGRDAVRASGVRASKDVLAVEVPEPGTTQGSYSGRILAPAELLASGKLLFQDRRGVVVVAPDPRSGEFEIEGLEPGEYRLHFFDEFLGGLPLDEFTIRSSEAVLGTFTLAEPVEVRGPWPGDPEARTILLAWQASVSGDDDTRAVLWERTGTPRARQFPGEYLLKVRELGEVVYEGPATVAPSGELILR